MATDIISCDLLGRLPSIAAQRWGGRKALVFKEQNWSYAEFEDEVQTLARALIAAGIRKGDKVALWLPNCPEFQFLLFAITRIGAVAVPLNTRYKSLDLAYALRRSRSALLVSCTHAGPVDLEAVLADALAESKASLWLKTVVMIGHSKLTGITPWSSFRAAGLKPEAHPPSPTIGPGDPALMMFTSGTTGQPKGVLLDHAGLKLCHDRARIMQLGPEDVQLTYLPLSHIYAIGYCVLMSFMSGASQVLMDVFNGQQAIRLIEDHRVTVIHGFEAHFADLLAARQQMQVVAASLRTASFATGAESARALAVQVQTELCETAASYGLTELWGGVTISPPGSTLSQRCEASGLAQPGVEIRIVDVNTGKVVPPDTVGEIQVRSYARLIAYHDDSEATAAALDSEGWFRTGDAGMLRVDGHLRYLARYKDMLKVGGENVAPAEIENLLCRIPCIRSAAVIGQRDARLQEVPVAFVVMAPESVWSEQEIIENLRGKVAKFKIPARVIFVDELPMTSTGKIQKEVLRARLRSMETKTD